MTKGTPDRYALYVGDYPDSWGAPGAEGELSNIRANPVEQTIRFEKPSPDATSGLLPLMCSTAKSKSRGEIGLIAP